MTGPRRDERGSAVVEFAWLGALLLVPVIWLVLSVFDVQRGAFATETAARSAARAYALAPDDAQGVQAARAAARLALEDQGVTGVPVSVEVSCTPYPRHCHSGTSVITVAVRTRVVLPLMPQFLGGDRPSFRLDSSHTVPIGQYQEIDRG